VNKASAINRRSRRYSAIRAQPARPLRFPRQAGKGTESKPEDDGGVQLNFKNSRIVRKSSAKAIAGARFSNRLPRVAVFNYVKSWGALSTMTSSAGAIELGPTAWLTSREQGSTHELSA